MGLLSILKKMKQKEKDVRLLMLYPYARFCSLMILLCVPSVVVLQLAIRLLVKGGLLYPASRWLAIGY